jgi:hypothetical protein
VNRGSPPRDLVETDVNSNSPVDRSDKPTPSRPRANRMVDTIGLVVSIGPTWIVGSIARRGAVRRSRKGEGLDH